MMNKNKIIIAIFLFLVLFSYGCSNQTQAQEDYNKCTSVCAATLGGEDFIILELCRQECRDQFLEEDN